MDTLTTRLLRQAIPLFNALAGLGVIMALATMLAVAKDVFIPVALAILLSFILAPVVAWLHRIGLARSASVAAAVMLALAVVVGVGWALFLQTSDLAGRMPEYKPVIREKLDALMKGASESGPFSRAGAALSELMEEVKTKDASGAKGVAAPIVVRNEDKSGFALAVETLSHLLHPIAVFAAVFLLAGFILSQREDLRNRFIRLAGADDLQKTTAALDDAGQRVAKLLLTQLLLNASFGLGIGGGLWLIGLPSPFLWGVLAGVLRFVPYVGAFIAMAPPLLIAFASDPHWTSFFWTLGLFLTIEPIVGHVIEPLLYGHNTGVSPLAVVVSAMLWAFLWGPVGLILATPLTVCIVVLGRHIERLAFLDILLGDRPALSPSEIYYQRMLAGDPIEAAQQAAEFLQQRSLSTYYDEVALAGLRRAHTDIIGGAVNGERLDRLVKASKAVIASLANVKGGKMSARAISAEARAAFELIKDAEASDTDGDSSDAAEPGDDWQGRTPVAVLYGGHALDELPARMLAQVADKFGFPARVASLIEADDATADDAAGVRIVILSFMEPQSRTYVRAIRKRAHRLAPDAYVVVCLWQEMDKDSIEPLRRQFGVDAVVTTTSRARAMLRQYSRITKSETPALAA